jgi:glycosyltransferase involved in cell wall biosynthesis
MTSPSDVSAVVCTLNSIASIEQCLKSLRASGAGELIVVDAGSTDGTREIANAMADQVLDDPGTGLGNARNVGIAKTTKKFILNMGSDNVMPDGQLQLMLDDLVNQDVQGVSAGTGIAGDDYIAFGLNGWRQGRFPPGPVAIIGTPTLFLGDLLRANPYDPTRKFSDDSELCERWARDFGAKFAISSARVLEIGKTSWGEVVARCHMYGVSDAEVFSIGSQTGWGLRRKLKSVLHPARVDFVEPLTRLDAIAGLKTAPFLTAFTTLRYYYWVRSTISQRRN